MILINYIHFESLESTNRWAKEHAATLDFEKITCITASEQTAGRGRFSRKWFSPSGQNIYASYVFTVPPGSSYLSNLGQILIYSCAMALKEKGFETKIKWPNDLLIQKRKVAGVLSETFPLNGETVVILGIGLNVNMQKEFLRRIDQPATSLAHISKREWDLQELLTSLSSHFVQNLIRLKAEGFSYFQAPFEKLLAYKNESISCNIGVKTLQGICHRITENGYLEVILPTGEKTLVAAGEIEAP